jgi:hypothetical protein
MSNDPINVGAWGVVDQDCPIKYVIDQNVVEFTFGARATYFQLITDQRALEDLLAKGAEALRELKKS